MTFLKFCVNVLNRNIKIQNIFYIVKVSKSIQPINVFNNVLYLKTRIYTTNQCIQQCFILKNFLDVFPMF
jgi:hypothetical protein